MGFFVVGLYSFEFVAGFSAKAINSAYRII